MDNFKGTPGPWEIIPASINGIEIENGDIRICEIIAENDEYLLTELEWDNARLIAAAPDLLEVCLKFQRHISESLMAKSPFGLDEAINKALGRG